MVGVRRIPSVTRPIEVTHGVEAVCDGDERGAAKGVADSLLDKFICVMIDTCLECVS
jgi:hypothetical protein